MPRKPQQSKARRATKRPAGVVTSALPAAPAHVAILGMGPSLDAYTGLCKRAGGRKNFCDETWGMNALGDVLVCDRIFHMDDVRIQEIRAAARPESNIAHMLKWIKSHPGPIYTSRTYPDYPGLVAMPLEALANMARVEYFNSTAAYCVAYAILIGVKKITLFGCDFTYPNAHHAEKGRACVEFWLGFARARGIDVVVPKTTSLMDALVDPRERCYGYDTVDRHTTIDADGRIRIAFTERATLPTADEIEASYDHSKHPNALVKD